MKIVSRYDVTRVLYDAPDAPDIKTAVVQAVASRAYLEGANLAGAYLPPTLPLLAAGLLVLGAALLPRWVANQIAGAEKVGIAEVELRAFQEARSD